MHGSPAWERLQGGIPHEITDVSTRRMLHDYATVTTILVNAINELMDERDRLHLRIDRRGTDINALGESCTKATAALTSRLYDSETGTIPTLAKKEDVADLTKLLRGVLVAVATAAIMLALNLVVTGRAG